MRKKLLCMCDVSKENNKDKPEASRFHNFLNIFFASLIDFSSSSSTLDFIVACCGGILVRGGSAGGLVMKPKSGRDVVFGGAELNGAWPVYRGPLGIDATFKPGYPDPVEMDPDIIKRVDARWQQYWTA